MVDLAVSKQSCRTRALGRGHAAGGSEHARGGVVEFGAGKRLKRVSAARAPAIKTFPLGSRVAVCSPLAAVMLPVGVNWPANSAMIVKFTAFDVPPPGAGLVTVTVGVPDEAIAATEIAPVNCVELANVVATAVPPKLTTEEDRKFVPLTVKVNAGLPARLPAGDIVTIVGGGDVET